MQLNKRHDNLVQLLTRLNDAAQSALPVSGQGCCENCIYRFDPLLDRTEAWAYTSFKPGTLATWDCNKTYNLRPIKFGNAVRYRLSSLNRFADARQRP
jgi:hypothetical protein